MTKKGTTLDLTEHMKIKMYIYFASSLLQLLMKLLRCFVKMGKIAIYFCHYANKVHLIVFNLSFIDFQWLASRTILHSRDLPTRIVLLAYSVVVFVGIDLWGLLSHLLDDRIWRKALEHYTSLRSHVSVTAISLRKLMAFKSNKRKKPVPEDRAPANESPADEEKKPSTDIKKSINYKKTYLELEFNVHVMDIATAHLRYDRSVFSSTTCRLLVYLLWLKVPIYQVVLISCQYVNRLGIFSLLAYELSVFIATIYAYLKYKYLKNLICLLMEVSQCLSMALFMLNALLISPKRFDESISDFYQDAGIWIVIASCVAEYLLLLTYIGVAAYEFFKNRSMMKKMNVKPEKYALIQYTNKPLGNREQFPLLSATKKSGLKKQAFTDTGSQSHKIFRHARITGRLHQPSISLQESPATIVSKSKDSYSSNRYASGKTGKEGPSTASKISAFFSSDLRNVEVTPPLMTSPRRSKADEKKRVAITTRISPHSDSIFKNSIQNFSIRSQLNDNGLMTQLPDSSSAGQIETSRATLNSKFEVR